MVPKTAGAVNVLLGNGNVEAGNVIASPPSTVVCPSNTHVWVTTTASGWMLLVMKSSEIESPGSMSIPHTFIAVVVTMADQDYRDT
jgi:hypothetical protein